MSPKSRLYTLVHAWKNKPFHELRDAQGTHVPNLAHETQDVALQVFDRVRAEVPAVQDRGHAHGDDDPGAA